MPQILISLRQLSLLFAVTVIHSAHSFLPSKQALLPAKDSTSQSRMSHASLNVMTPESPCCTFWASRSSWLCPAEQRGLAEAAGLASLSGHGTCRSFAESCCNRPPTCADSDITQCCIQDIGLKNVYLEELNWLVPLQMVQMKMWRNTCQHKLSRAWRLRNEPEWPCRTSSTCFSHCPS